MITVTEKNREAILAAQKIKRSDDSAATNAIIGHTSLPQSKVHSKLNSRTVSREQERRG